MRIVLDVVIDRCAWATEYGIDLIDVDGDIAEYVNGNLAGSTVLGPLVKITEARVTA